jgi:crotonobetainyl-CoA:carnitine CoA-transferase CaiB-like acyl-CoA transferase
MGSAHASVVPYQALQTRDGNLIIAVFAEKFWSGFCLAVEHPEWVDDARFRLNRDRHANRSVLVSMIEALFRTRTTDDWLERLRTHGVPAAPILTVDRVLADPQVKQRGMVAEMSHPVQGTVPTLGTPIKVDGTMTLDVAPPARLGQDTDDVLTTLLGYARDRVARLRDAGAVA